MSTVEIVENKISSIRKYLALLDRYQIPRTDQAMA